VVAGQPELEEEQRFLDRAHEGLDAMRADSQRMLESVLDLGRGGTFQSRTERDIVVRTSLARLAQLDIGDQALCFGRIDVAPTAPNAEPESFHIGRLAVSDTAHEPLVVDWRAPVAEPFYRATGLSPQGLSRRRHLAVQAKRVIGLEDEYFDVPGTAGTGRGLERAGEVGSGTGTLDGAIELGGPGALLAAVGRARTGQMGDIVATIQREQDEIIRSPLPGLLLVQGGPGTGKTAVALHRAAYLLYTHRFPLERQGVLVVGPNPLFLRYIEQVLPSLGETGVTLSTVSGLVAEVRPTAVDPPGVAKLKGEARMARLIGRAVRDRQRRLRQEVRAPFGSTVLRLDVEDSQRIVTMARRRPGTHNARRRFVELQVGSLLAEQYRAFREQVDEWSGRVPTDRLAESMSPQTAAADADAPATDADELGVGDSAESELDLVDISRQIRRLPEIAAALNRMWPRLAPHELVHDLLGARPLLASAGRGILDDAEQAALYRPRSTRLDDVEWTPADTALVDEARTILGPRQPRPTRAEQRDRDARRPDATAWPKGLAAAATGPAPPGPADEIRSFGHIVVDEAQDLSPMQLRMLARRSISGSMTVVGDIAQATGPWTPGSWGEVTEHLAPRRPVRLVELTVSYRTPAEAVAVSARVLKVAAPDLTPPRAVRRSGNPPHIEAVPSASLGARVAAVTAAQLDRLGNGRVAVLAPGALLADLGAALSERGLHWTDPRDPSGEGLASPLVLLPADQANGLEFDGVVVVEPALIAAEPSRGERPPVPSTRGLRTLYVALTRLTQELAVVHAMPLPVELTET
jgi:DNA helicase IV